MLSAVCGRLESAAHAAAAIDAPPAPHRRRLRRAEGAIGKSPRIGGTGGAGSEPPVQAGPAHGPPGPAYRTYYQL